MSIKYMYIKILMILINKAQSIHSKLFKPIFTRNVSGSQLIMLLTFQRNFSILKNPKFQSVSIPHFININEGEIHKYIFSGINDNCGFA